MNMEARANAVAIDTIARLMEAGEITRRNALDLIDSVWRDAQKSGMVEEVSRLLVHMALNPHPKKVIMA
jgi:hypothetical protein